MLITATTIQAKGGLSQHQIDEMIKQAEVMRKSDMERKELLEAKNKAEQLIYDTNKMLKNQKHLLSQGLIEKVTAASNELSNTIELVDNKQLNEFRQKVENLQILSMEMGKEIYSQSNSGNNSKNDCNHNNEKK